jgi:hypothetical protein
MSKCYYCGKTDGSHDMSCICGKPTPPAMNAASQREPIPAGVYYSKHLDNFYDMEDEYGMGHPFYDEWYSRRAEFPDESSGSGSAPADQAGPEHDPVQMVMGAVESTQKRLAEKSAQPVGNTIGEYPAMNAASPTDIAEVLAEVSNARANWPPFNSAHEGFAVLSEEVDELKAHVWTNQRRRDLPAMRKEAMQVAAMALRFMGECCDETTGRK